MTRLNLILILLITANCQQRVALYERSAPSCAYSKTILKYESLVRQAKEAKDKNSKEKVAYPGLSGQQTYQIMECIELMKKRFQQPKHNS